LDALRRGEIVAVETAVKQMLDFLPLDAIEKETTMTNQTETASNLVEEAVNRVIAIEWRYDSAKFSSHIVLVREYLRRIALWESKFHAGPWPWLDVASVVEPVFNLDKSVEDALEEHFHGLRAGSRQIMVCKSYIKWCAISNRPDVNALHLPAPYDPLIALYERGGYFRIEHGFYVDVDEGYGFHLGHIMDHLLSEPFTDLSHDNLDILDLSK